MGMYHFSYGKIDRKIALFSEQLVIRSSNYDSSVAKVRTKNMTDQQKCWR